jgi:quinol-cytochrome oxidoreductase complex cytochrome b subunit
MFGSILILFVLPWIDRSPVRSAKFRPIYKQFFWIFLADCIVLGYIGAKPPEGMFLIVGRVATAYYFLHFVIIFVLSYVERPRPLPKSISEAVLKGGGAAAVVKAREKA